MPHTTDARRIVSELTKIPGWPHEENATLDLVDKMLSAKPKTYVANPAFLERLRSRLLAEAEASWEASGFWKWASLVKFLSVPVAFAGIAAIASTLGLFDRPGNIAVPKVPRTVVTDAEPEEKAVLKEEGDRGPKEIRKAGGMEKPLAKIEKTAPADVPVLAEISQKTDAIQKTAPVSATENSDASDGSAETMAFSTQAPEPMAALMPAGAPSMKMSAPIADTATVSSGPSDSYSGTGFANVGSVGLSASVRPDGLVDLDRDYSKWPETPCESGSCALSMENVPTDEELVGVTRKFAQDWNVDLSAYANPVADSSWKNSNADGTVPESVSVTYAKKTDGASDLVFSIDMRTKKVSSVRAIQER